MITISKLEFDNMFSYGKDNVIDFNKNKVTQLVGSNGVGKSSIPAILEEALYNKNSRGIKKSEIKNRNVDDKYYSCSVHFRVNSDGYTLHKKVTTTAKVTLKRNGQDISGHTATQTYKKVEEILGLDFNTFSKLVYQSMLSSLDFLKSTDTNRKKFLIGLLGLEKYVEAEQTVKEASKQTRDTITSIQSSIDTIQAWVKKNPASMEPKTETEVPELDETLKESLVNLTVQKANIDEHNKDALKNAKHQQAFLDLQKEQHAPTAYNPELLEKVTREKQRIEAEDKVAKLELKKLKAVKDTCPTCGQSIEIGDTKEAIDRLVAELGELEDAKAKVLEVFTTESEARSAHEAYKAWKDKLNTAQALYDSHKPTEQISSADLTADISKLKADILKLETDIRNAKDYNESVRIHNSKVDSHNSTLEQYLTEIKEKTAELNTVKDVAADLDVLIKALGTKGLIQYKIESMVKVFEDLINQYLVQLSDGRFALTFSIEDTKLTLSLYDNSELIGVNSPSSGEFNRINTATLLAVRKMMSSISKVNINLLFLDEVISVLDDQGKETLIDILLNEQSLNSMIVSHGFEHPLAESIVIKKENNISCLQN